MLKMEDGPRHPGFAVTQEQQPWTYS